MIEAGGGAFRLRQLTVGLAGAVVCAQLAAACSSRVEVPFTPNGVVAGSRLRPVYWVADGGAEVFDGWYDTEFEDRCTFLRVEDGSERCLPALVPVVFTDSGCTQPALHLGRSCFDDRDAQLGRTPGAPGLSICDMELSQGYPRIYRRLPGDALNASSYWTLSSDGMGGVVCSEEEVALEGVEALYAAELIAPAPFVRAERVVVEGTGPLGRLERRAEDGATEVVEAHITALDEPCDAFDLNAPNLSCRPTNVVIRSRNDFRNADCTDATARVTCADDTVVAEVSDDACEPDRLFQRGEPLGEIYSDGPGGCRKTETDSHYTVGAPITPPAMTVVARGDGDVIGRFVTDGAGMEVRPAQLALRDGTWCLPERDPDDPDRIVCAPFVFSASAYADPSCTQPAALAACGQPPFHWWLVEEEPSNDACGTARWLVAPPTGPVGLDAIYIDTGDECVGTPTTDRYYVAGDAVPLSSFPEIRSETR